MEEYSVKFYKNCSNGQEPVLAYIEKLDEKNKAKVLKYIAFLKDNRGYLDEPFSKHITGKIRELRVDFSRRRHRIFYFTAIGKRIILLHCFLKKTERTPPREIKKALTHYNDAINNLKLYD